MHNHNKKQDEFNLRIRSMSAMDLGNYTCSLAMDNALSSPVDSVTMLVDKLPPPPEFYSKKDRVNATSQLLSWTGQFSTKSKNKHFNILFKLTLMLLIPFHLILYCCIFNVFAFLQNAFYEKEMITLSVQNYVDPARSNFLLYLMLSLFSINRILETKNYFLSGFTIWFVKTPQFQARRCWLSS